MLSCVEAMRRQRKENKCDEGDEGEDYGHIIMCAHCEERSDEAI